MIFLRLDNFFRTIILICCTVLVLFLTSGCNKTEAADMKNEPGSIDFIANGEDFVRYGFIDKDGWAISFDKFYINIVDAEAYSLSEGKKALLSGAHWVDLAAVKDKAGTLVIGKLVKVPAGNYQSLKFKIRRQTIGEYKGFSLVMIGKALKENERVYFTIKLDEEMDYDGRDGFVGEEVKGLLKPGSATSVEMTFHVAQLFGDKSVAPEDPVNSQSVGFDYFKQFARQGKLSVTQSALKSLDKEQTGYLKLVKAIWNLGQLGEGHCEVSDQSSAAEVTLAVQG